METRVVLAYTLYVIMAVVLAFTLGRYVRNKQWFKHRQMGRGKNVPIAPKADPNPSE
jgi:hypothetical protein